MSQFSCLSLEKVSLAKSLGFIVYSFSTSIKMYSGRFSKTMRSSFVNEPPQNFAKHTSRCYHQNKHWFFSSPKSLSLLEIFLSPHQSGFWVWWVFRLKQITTEKEKKTKKLLRVINSELRRIIAIKNLNRSINNKYLNRISFMKFSSWS